MDQHSLLYTLALLIAAVASGATAVFLWTRRSVPGAIPLVVFTSALVIWSFTYACFWLAASSGARFLWLNATYFGVVLAPGSFAVFVLMYTGRERWVNWKLIGLLSIEPILALVFLWTDPFFNLFFAGKRTADSSAILAGGPGYLFHVIYSYILIVVTYGMLVQAYRRAQKPFRQQMGVILVGISLPLLVNIISIANLNPVPELDATPLAFTLTAVILTYAIFSRQFLDLVPVARSRVMDMMHEPVFVTDRQDRIVDLNPAAQRLLADLIHLDQESVFGIPLPAQLNIPQDPLRSDNMQREIQLQVGPRVHYFEERVAPLADGRGKLLGKVLTLHDVTRRKHAEQRELEIKLEKERVHLLMKFVQDTSHEFRTPLAIINSSAGLMARIDDAQKRFLKAQRIEDQVARMTRLLDSLLTITSLDSSPAEMAAVNIGGLLMSLCSEMKGMPDVAETRCEIPANLPPVYGNNDLLRDAISQLLDNARRYTPSTGEIAMSAYSDDQYVMINVRDNGSGIPKEDVPHIFETFWRQDKAHTTPGLGLGLAIAQKIIQLHSGRIEVQSEVGKYTSFHITLPIAKAS